MIREAQISDLVFLNEMLHYFNTTVTEEELANHPFKKYLVIDKIGFISFSKMYEKMEIEYIYIGENYRGKGYAKGLIGAVLKYPHKSITLEVKKSNIMAINLYKTMGFKELAIRKNYYQNEDGILMGRDNYEHISN